MKKYKTAKRFKFTTPHIPTELVCTCFSLLHPSKATAT